METSPELSLFPGSAGFQPAALVVEAETSPALSLFPGSAGFQPAAMVVEVETSPGLSQFGMCAFGFGDPVVHPASAEISRSPKNLPGFNTASFCESNTWTQALSG